ncbi:MAG: phytoene desaturase family protein [Bacteroidota bacterium]|nr:phytoene desaturase family protein [Bacteroidota bacterium]
MNNKPKAVIIGAGVGGIATAAFLAQNGYAVEVFEKNARPGGRCGQLIQEGHRFDLGATILLMPSLYRKVLSELGIDLEKDLETTSLEPVYKLFFSDGSDFAFTRNPEKMKAQLEAIEPGSFLKFQEYVKEGYEFFNLSINDLLGKNFDHLFQFVNLKSMRLLLKLKVWIFHTDYIKRFFKNRHLRMAFTFQNIYVGQNPYQAPAFFSMLPGAEIAEGALFPKGGMHRIVEKLLEKATSLGVTIHYKKPIEKIILNCNKTEGILLEDGTIIHADLVIASADLPYVYKELLPDKEAADRLKKRKYSCSAIVFHWGVDKVYPQLDHHSVFLNDPYKDGLNKIFKEKSLSREPSFYIHAPVRSDKSAAPENHDTLSVIVPVAHIDTKYDQDWKKLKQTARAGVISRLKKAGMDDIEDHIKFEVSYLPKTWKKTCNVTRGSVFGSLEHTIFQMGYFRPHNQHKKYRNLYFAGGSTHPGNGVPLVLLGAKLTTERILNDAKMTVSAKS